MVIALVLFATVALIFYLYWYEGMALQQKAFLTSGILFLLVTSITGIAYILLSFAAFYTPEHSVPLLRLHAFTALYGWNLSGLAVISATAISPLNSIRCGSSAALADGAGALPSGLLRARCAGRTRLRRAARPPVFGVMGHYGSATGSHTAGHAARGSRTAQ